MSRYFRFSYTNIPKGGRERETRQVRRDINPKIFQVRDGAAFHELAAVLSQNGHQYGTLIHNYPFHAAGQAEFDFLKPDDILLVTTRPPLSDVRAENRRYVLESGSFLEKAIFEELRKYFSLLSRAEVCLSDHAASFLKEEDRDKADMEFYQHGSARIHRHRQGHEFRYKELPGGSNITACYFLHLGRMKNCPCRLIVSFGMGGYENLIWNRLVRLRHPLWLQKPVFVFAEITLPKKEPVKPITPTFCDTYAMRLLIERDLGKRRG